MPDPGVAFPGAELVRHESGPVCKVAVLGPLRLAPYVNASPQSGDQRKQALPQQHTHRLEVFGLDRAI